MSDYLLEPIAADELALLASGRMPPRLHGLASRDALPPAFVARRALQWLADGVAPPWAATYYIRDADARVLGGCGFKGPPRHGEVEIGYAVAAAHRRRGVASAAARQLIVIAFASAQVQRVLACIDERNLASARLAQGLGFVAGERRQDPDDGAWRVHWRLPRAAAPRRAV
ncbi:GNAT family N-acetyltransferase [Xanthomonas sp. AmX2]|uniref:GNAT family N-acetyltransferase n=1 Tax=Xanthomonas sp. TaxID=29446 RepID=UPI00197EB793|nr:GNAT family N-acetyltransferase [Xanthomonas sp.]MBN6149218.1 GNAT family N-acetyltransferase [Xanthomonas sp.]